MSDFKDYLEKQLENPEFRAEYEALCSEYKARGCDFMSKYTLEDLGWRYCDTTSDDGYLSYVRDNEWIYIDMVKRKLFISRCSELSFATLEAIREMVISNAIY